MPRRLIVRAQAEGDVDEIAVMIARDNLRASLRFYDRVQETFDRLSMWPYIGTRRRVRDQQLAGLRSTLFAAIATISFSICPVTMELKLCM